MVVKLILSSPKDITILGGKDKRKGINYNSVYIRLVNISDIEANITVDYKDDGRKKYILTLDNILIIISPGNTLYIYPDTDDGTIYNLVDRLVLNEEFEALEELRVGWNLK